MMYCIDFHLNIFSLFSSKCEKINWYNGFMKVKMLIYELNKRIDEIKNHSMNNSFVYAMKKKINSS
jgi:hypothetical protein